MQLCLNPSLTISVNPVKTDLFPVITICNIVDGELTVSTVRPTSALAAVPTALVPNQLVVVPDIVPTHLAVGPLQEDAAPITEGIGITVSSEFAISEVRLSDSRIVLVEGLPECGQGGGEAGGYIHSSVIEVIVALQ